MSRLSEVSVTAVAVLTLVGSLLSARPGAAQDEAPDSSAGIFCALLTSDEISAALGSGPVTASGGDADCTYETDGLELDTSVEAGALADLGGSLAGYQDVTVAGQPGALYSDTESSELYVAAKDGLLVLDLYGDLPEASASGAALESLAAVELARIGTITIPTPEPPPTPSPFCAVLTLAEVSAAIGIDAVVGDSFDDYCLYEDSGEGLTALEVSLDPGNLADTRPDYPDGVDATVGGQPALQSADGSFLFVETGGGVLTLRLIAEQDQAAAQAATLLAGLGATALGRLPSIPRPSQPPE